MSIDTDTIEDIIEEERDLVFDADEKHGEYWSNAVAFGGLLSFGIESVDFDRYVFATFLSQVKKYHLLASLSAVRLHHVQAMMDLRQMIEAAACAAYAIANPDIDGFVVKDESGMLDADRKLVGMRYKWLDKHYPTGSQALKNLKKLINDSSAHSNLIYAHKNFGLGDEARTFSTPYFDVEDDHMVKSDLWLAANIVMGAIDLFYGVARDHGGVVFTKDFVPRLKELEVQNHALKAELLKNMEVRAKAREKAK